MIGKRTMATSSSLFLMLLGLGVFFATYNLVTMLIHHQRQESGRELLGGDPVTRMPVELRRSVLSRRPFHVAVTATDAPYSRWQCRIMYYWYKEMKEKEGSEMGGFTRVLHSGEPDSLMDEIPTFVVNPLPNGADRGYIVLNRPWAFVQWLEKATIEEEYILMAEPDHIFVKPLPNLAREDYPAAFPFFYIKPNEHVQIIRKYFPDEKGPVTNIDPIGNSPVIIKKTKLQKIAPTWMNVSLSMKEDPVTDKAFGWVLEMYAYAIASALHGVQHILRKDFMIQPPWDLKLGNTFIIHFTYGCDYSLKGELTYGKIGEWRFDKRSYLSGPPPRNLPLPPPGVPESVGLARLRTSLNLLGIRNTFSFKEIFFVLAILHLGHYYTTLRNSKKRIPNDLDSSSYKTGENSRDEDKVTLVKMVNEATANIPGWNDGR